MKNVQFLGSAIFAFCLSSSTHAAHFADSVVSYNAGTNATGAANFTNYQAASSAVGPVASTTGSGQYDGVISPFNPAYQANQIVQLGKGGSITLHLGNTAYVGSGYELGVFTGVSFADDTYPNGTIGSSVSLFSSYPATIEVSLNGINWVSLGLENFTIPANYYNDPSNVGPYAASAPANTPTTDFGKPFTGTLADFNGKSSYADVLGVLNGSGGGTWFSLGNTGLSQVNYVRFTNASDATANFSLDAVAVSNASTAAVPEPGALSLVVISGLTWFISRRRNSLI